MGEAKITKGTWTPVAAISEVLSGVTFHLYHPEGEGIRMETVFELSKVRQLVDDNRLTTILIADTNILMKEPDFSKWKVSDSEVMFIISDVTIMELEIIKHRKKDEQEACKVARQAMRSIGELFSKGKIVDGIYINNVGWFISVPSPKESKIWSELKELNSIVKAYGEPDTKLLLLTGEILETIPDIQAIFVTADMGLFNIVCSHGIPAYLFKDFPITEFGAYALKTQLDAGISWDRVLEDIQRDTETRSINVALTLTQKSTTWPWDAILPAKTPLLLAEGYGVINVGKGVGFSWSLPMSEWNYPFLADQANEYAEFYSKLAYLDFSGRDSGISEEVTKKLAEQIAQCAHPFAHLAGLPTLSNPVSIVKYFYHSIYFKEELWEEEPELFGHMFSEEDALEQFEEQFGEEYKKASSFEGFGIRIFASLAANFEEDKTPEGLRLLFTALRNHWNVGETKTINITLDPSQSHRA